MMLKLSVVYERGAILVVAALAQHKNRLLTKSVTVAELSEAGNQCAICHVSLQPRHAFPGARSLSGTVLGSYGHTVALSSQTTKQ